MNRADLFDLMDALCEELNVQTILDELAQGLSADELEYQLTSIATAFDLDHLVSANAVR